MCRLYDFHPDGQEDLLIDTMKMLKYTGDPWEDVFKAEVSNSASPRPLLTGRISTSRKRLLST